MRRFIPFLPALALTLVLPSPAAAILLQLPIACAPGASCFVQNYVDHEAGRSWKDYRCGHLSYDGHDGTDFRLPSLVEMQAGVNVLAAADGVVKNTRDNMKDIGLRNVDPAALKGYECGNGVVLEHEEGWSTQYCHMKQGSIAVKPGDEVHAGDVLGQVGFSGMTEFPHLHLTLRHNDEIIDPFTGTPPRESCGQSGFTQWKPDAEKALAYNPPGLLAAGFSSETPDLQGIMEGKFRETSLPANSAVLYFWIQVYGPREGDVIQMTLTRGEHGESVAQYKATLEKSKADYLQYIGKKNPPPGEYFARFSLVRTTEKEGPKELAKYEGKVSVEEE